MCRFMKNLKFEIWFLSFEQNMKNKSDVKIDDF